MFYPLKLETFEWRFTIISTLAQVPCSRGFFYKRRSKQRYFIIACISVPGKVSLSTSVGFEPVAFYILKQNSSFRIQIWGLS